MVAVDAVVWGSSCTKLTKCTGYLVDVESLSSGGGCGSGCVLCVACGGHQRCTHLMSGVCSNLPKKKQPKRKHIRPQRANTVLCRSRIMEGVYSPCTFAHYLLPSTFVFAIVPDRGPRACFMLGVVVAVWRSSHSFFVTVKDM